ncbi:NADP-dependent malic enzyme [Candidatus Micrarchaeota archaeon]|nr:NADP-dependent malic enzyme [Candidatus Micrarchaeota archaeon]
MTDLNSEAIELHAKFRGKMEIKSRVAVNDGHALAVAYTPGVAEPCRRINKNKELVYEYTNKWNFVAVVTDGTRVLGLGDIGPEAGMPVMEGKCVLFKEFGGVDAFPICLATKDADEIVKTVKNIAPVFGGINLEDVENPKCFEVEKRLIEELDIPVFHDDQHGTAVITLAGVTNALKIVGKKLGEVRIALNGAGAANIAITKLLVKEGARDLVLCDSKGAIFEGREGMHDYKAEVARVTNKSKMKGSLAEVIKEADVFIGASGPGLVSVDMVKSMANDAVVFAVANPVPEIYPDEAKKGGARIVGTGRSDFPNQINNVLGFPGIFRGALDVRAKKINEEMKVAAAYAIAGVITDSELNEENVVPSAFDERVCPAVASAVAEAAMKTGVARVKKTKEEIIENAKRMVKKSR